MSTVGVCTAMPARRSRADPAAGGAAPLRAAVDAGRLPRDGPDGVAEADAGARLLAWPDIPIGRSAQPRIGGRASGNSRAVGRSRTEQSAAVSGGDDTTERAVPAGKPHGLGSSRRERVLDALG